MLNTIRKFTAIALLFGTAVGTVPAQSGRDYKEEQARRERQIQACMRPAGLAFQKALQEAQQNLREAERKAQQDYSAAVRNNKSDAAREAARKAKQEALRKAQDESQQARRAAQQDKQQAEQSCRNPKQPETTNNNPPGNTTEGTLGHGPRGRNPSVRMDLRVVDETGKPVQGVKTKLWSERQSNGFLCETFHTTDALGKVLMDPIHFTKTLQLKLEARGFEPQMIQVEPSQLDKPFRAVMQAKKS